MAIALEDGREGDEVRLKRSTWGQHLLEQTFGSGKITTLHASIQDRVVSDRVVRHSLVWHLVEKLKGALQVLLQAVTFDERSVEDCVFVLSFPSHLMEDVDGRLQTATLHAGIDHASVGHGICLGLLLLHLFPNLEYFLKVSCLAVGFHQDSKRHRRWCYLERLHHVDRRLETGQVLEPAAGIQQGVEENFVNVLRLLLNESLHKNHATVDS
mmetsp:Transcript_83247/g.147080  ORF Transcript_83247/g.147080 Transcript_83247/m.147080 type:complete len:212 (-) Transcript_83247:375-1010(-)